MNVAELKKICIVILGALLNAIALNLFLIPANVYSSGFAGLAQLLSSIIDLLGLPFSISTGIILFILNVPIAIIAWKKVGKSFTFYSFLSVALLTLFMEIVPVKQVSPDIILNAVFGGVIGALGVGITLKFGASTGGMDVVALLLSKSKDRPVGVYLFILNGLIIVAAGILYGPEKSLYTLVALYATTRVVDAIHTRHEKLTVFIVTNKSQQLKEAIHAKLVRGITLIPAKGAFTNENKDMMMIVITRYELYDIQHIISDVDPHAFTNIVETSSVLGVFRKD
ncbi:YitT family protein [Bacillus sp. AGMB 02131]|uniref:YitT family protein n=1 Tax=Peribacillus faecalis TaxID=2772559 RepID=A0A927D0B0_9BACI|nr:YitT family protein [Peribacillus faecalis]MBD3110306.1 YitT family protein [Peribacillus faecalis]